MNVKGEAHIILDKFGKDLESVKLDKRSGLSKKGLSYRKEKKGEECDKDFKTIMFKNAPRANDLYLLLEKGSWT